MVHIYNIDMRKEFDILQNQFSMSILLIRSNNNTRCKCYDPLHRSGNRKCKVCGGSGKINTIEKIQGIHQNSDSGSPMKLTELGLSAMNTISFYLDRKYVPKSKDQILIVGFDNNGCPVDIKKDCTIVSVQEVRGDDGRIEFYHVYAKYSPDKILIDQKRLNAIPKEQKMQIAKGKRYTWPQE